MFVRSVRSGLFRFSFLNVVDFVSYLRAYAFVCAPGPVLLLCGVVSA